MHRLNRVWPCLVAAFLLLTLNGVKAVAQTTTATLSGMVEDQNSAAVPGATITIRNNATSFERIGTTNESGAFTFPLLQPGSYTVTVRRDGFTVVQIREVILNVGDQKSIQVGLKVGDVNAQVEVRSDASLVRTDGSVGTVIDRTFVENLPLNGRTIQSLITLTPGVTITAAQFGNEGQFSVNGQRADGNYFTVDGVSANIGISMGAGIGPQAGSGSLPGFSAFGSTANLVSLDALQEFKIQTSTYAPEYGRSTGAQVQIVTRSGDNELHGKLFHNFRNDALDATDWFANANRLPKPSLKQNAFGAVLGGPVMLPRFGDGGSQPWYNGKDRTFFFFSYEGLRLRLPQIGLTTVPTLISRQNAASGIQPYLKTFPLPNGRDLGSGFAEFNASYSDEASLDATSIRIDHNLERLKLFGRYNYSPSEGVQRGAGRSLSTLSSIVGKTQTLTLGGTWLVSPSIANDFRFNYSKNKGGQVFSLDEFGGAVVPPDSAFFPSAFGRENGLLVFSVTDGTASSFALGRNSVNVQRQINLVNNLVIVANDHNIKFGVDYRRLSPFTGPRQYSQQASFNNLATAIAGRATSVRVQASKELAAYYTNFSAYGQDTWNVSRNFTLTYGLRWEINPPPHADQPGLYSLANLTDPVAFAIAPKGTPLYETTYFNIAPRIGAAISLSEKKGKETVLRGGFGVFYDLGSQTTGNLLGPLAFPFGAEIVLPNPVFPLIPANATPPNLPDPSNPVFPINLNGFYPDLKLPYTLHWNATIDQSLGANQVASVSYVAAVGRRLLMGDLYRNPNPKLTTAIVTTNDGTSDYHALQLQFRRRLSKGLQYLASYTWSKSIDIVSSDSAAGIPGARLDPRTNRGPSSFDVRHALSAAVTYDLPSPFSRGFGDMLFGDWSLDAIFVARTATPVDVSASANLGFGLYSVRPDLIQGVPLYLDDRSVAGGKRFNPAAFNIAAPVAARRQGTLGRNALRGFPMSQLDLALGRQFSLTERLKFQFKMECYNILNRPNFANPVGTLTSSSFGRSTQMLGKSLGAGGVQGGLNPLYQIGGPRSLQFTLKLSF